MTDSIDLWCQHMAAGNLTPETIKLRRAHLVRALRDLSTPIGQLTVEQVTAWVAGHDWAPATRRSYRASLVQFFRFVGRDDIAEHLPRARVPRSLPRPAVDRDVLDALRSVEPRVQLMIELMAFGGLRRGEVCKIKAGDLNGEWLTVTGKGGHTRLVPLPGHLCAKIRGYRGWLFPGAIDGHLSPRRVGELVSAALPDGVTAHKLRHRFATTVYQQTHDIRAVQSLLGHAKLDTTMIYVHVSDEDQRTAASRAWSLVA